MPDAEGLFHFDEAAAARAEKFFPKYLRQTKGEWARKPLVLEPWQTERLIRPIYGWLREDGSRRYRTVFLEVARKNGKSTICAGFALELLFYDKEEGAEIYSAAADKDQARIVFSQAKDMVDASEPLRSRAKVFKDAIEFSERRAVYRVLSADAFSKHGLNAHGIIFDELHAQPNRELWDVLTTSTGARRQPLTIAITTAGYDRNSICYEQYDYAKKIEAGIIDDPSFLPVIYEADPKDDWKAAETWRKANPNLGVSVKLDYLEQEARKAASMPAYENTFRRLHLNQWTEQASRWIPMDAWDACALPVLGPQNEMAKQEEGPARGAECFGGLDLASTTDIASLCLDFVDATTGDHRSRWWHWIASANAHKREVRDRVPYVTWAREGFIKLTEGDVIDYDVIRADIVELGKQFKVKEIAYDRWNAQQLVTQLEGDGFTMVPVGMGFASMTAPSKFLENLVTAKQLKHGGNPVARWCASNVAVEQDAAGNLKPSKKRSTEKIDAIVALILALSRSMLQREKAKSVYETRGILTLGGEASKT